MSAPTDDRLWHAFRHRYEGIRPGRDSSRPTPVLVQMAACMTGGLIISRKCRKASIRVKPPAARSQHCRLRARSLHGTCRSQDMFVHTIAQAARSQVGNQESTEHSLRALASIPTDSLLAPRRPTHHPHRLSASSASFPRVSPRSIPR